MKLAKKHAKRAMKNLTRSDNSLIRVEADMYRDRALDEAVKAVYFLTHPDAKGRSNGKAHKSG